MTDEEYGKLVKNMSPRSPILRDCLGAFFVGGTICALGQLILRGYLSLGLSQEDSSLALSMTLVFLGSLFTGMSLYDDLAKYAGAGTLVPITGFSNAVTAAAMEYRTEGFILGVGAKMFTIAGPVIVYGTAASVVYGFLYWLFTRLL